MLNGACSGCTSANKNCQVNNYGKDLTDKDIQNRRIHRASSVARYRKLRKTLRRVSRQYSPIFEPKYVLDVSRSALRSPRHGSAILDGPIDCILTSVSSSLAPSHGREMEETKEEPDRANSEKRGSHESFPWDDWTVIDNGEYPKNHMASQPVNSSDASSDTSYSNIDNTSDAEEAREGIEVMSEDILEPCPSMKSSEESVYQCNEESDGVSVITESDGDEPAGDRNNREVVAYQSASRAPALRREDNADRMFMKVLNIMIACSLVAVIGLGAGRILNMDGNRPIDTDLQFVTLKMESSRLLEQMKELSGVKEILEEIKSSILQDRAADAAKLQDPTGNEAKKLPYLRRQFNTLDSSTNNPDSTLYERQQIFLHTICLLLEDIRQPNGDSETFQSTCDSHSLLSDLKSLHKLLNGVINQMDPPERSMHQRFLQNVEFQMNSMSDSLVLDLTRALDKLSFKNQKRLGKIGFKLNERLCILSNTLPSDSKLRESLEKNNTFLDKCDDIASRKSDKQSKAKWKGEPASSQPSKIEKKNSKKREAPVAPNFNTKSRGSSPKRQNTTTTYDPVDAKKCYSDNLPSFMHDSDDSDNTCAVLMAPPRSTWKLKHKPYKVESGKIPKSELKKSSEEWLDKNLPKGDREVTNTWKKKTSKDFDRSKFRKTGASSNGDDDTQTMKNTKGGPNEKTRSGAVPPEPPITNPDVKYKRQVYPPKPTGNRKRNFEKENNEFLAAERGSENSKVEGNWQFERNHRDIGHSYRSRIRDQQRIEDSMANWYFDRMGNRKNWRMNCDGKNQDPRCGMLYH